MSSGDVWRNDKRGHIRGSKHYIKLAVDLNLFKNGKYLRGTRTHYKFGMFWKNLGHTWGGIFGDGNHYEY